MEMISRVAAVIGLALAAAAGDTSAAAEHSHAPTSHLAPRAAPAELAPPAAAEHHGEPARTPQGGRDLLKEMESMPAHDHGADHETCCRIKKPSPTQ
jgi:hypothetical protein